MVEKLPKQLLDAFTLIRRGYLQDGISQLEKVNGFERHKAISLAEISYFENDWIKGLSYSFQFLPFPDTWYFSNIFDDHLQLLLKAAFITNKYNECSDFLKSLALEYEKVIPEKHILRQYLFKINATLSSIENKQNTIKEFENSKFEYRDTGVTLIELQKQQQEYRPDLNNSEIKVADYLLYFLHREGKTDDFIQLYEQYEKDLFFENHLRAAKEYLACGSREKAEKAIINYTIRWSPFEPPQVEPVILLIDNIIQPVMTSEFCQTILLLNKEEAGVDFQFSSN